MRNSEAYADTLIEVNIDLFQSKLERTSKDALMKIDKKKKKNFDTLIDLLQAEITIILWIKTQLFNDDKETPPQDANFQKTLTVFFYIRCNVMKISNVIISKTTQDNIMLSFLFFHLHSYLNAFLGLRSEGL